MDKDDPILTTMRFIPKHETIQKYSVILPDNLSNQAMKESNGYKTYYDLATRKVISKPKYVWRSTREKTNQSSKASSGEILKATTKVAKLRKNNLPAKGLETLSEVALFEVKQMKKLQPKEARLNSTALKSANQISWKSSDDEDNDDQDDDGADDQDDDGQDDDNEQTELDNDGDDFVHPKLSTFDEEERHEKKLDKEAEGLDLRVQTPSHFKSIDDDSYDELTQGDNHSSSVSSGFISSMLNPNSDTGIDSILNLHTKSNSMVDVPVTTNVEMPPSSINEAVKTAIQLQLDRLRDEAKAENEDFINKIDESIKKIIKEQVQVQVKEQVSKILLRIEKFVNEHLEAEVLTHSSNKAKASHAVAANLSEHELKKILIDKMENTVKFKRPQDDEDEDEELFDGSNRGSKRRRSGKEPESTSAPKEKTSKSTGSSKKGSKSKTRSTDQSAQAEEEVHTDKDLEKPTHRSSKQKKTLPTVHGPIQPWINTLAQKEDPCESFNELMDTPLDFSAFVLNRLNVDTLNPELLVGPTFELMKGSCKSLVELEYFLKEIFKSTTDQLDWNNPEGQQYPLNLRKPLPLLPNLHSRQVKAFDHCINNDLAYLCGGVLSRTYTTSVTKKKVGDYGHIKWIEDLVPNTI
nr:hypothetical protein [Tanacetum cinerariifolium]